MTAHRWDLVRAMSTVIESVPSNSRGVHESVTRGFQILREVKSMLSRGDSVETVLAFIEWAESPPADQVPE